MLLEYMKDIVSRNSLRILSVRLMLNSIYKYSTQLSSITAECHVILLRSRKYRVWSDRIPTQSGQLPVTTWVYKSETKNINLMFLVPCISVQFNKMTN
jgi:hypothetical protein